MNWTLWTGSGTEEINCGYLHLQFPSAAPAAVLALLDGALAERGWHGDEPSPAALYRGWTHQPAGLRLARAVIGFHPVAVTVGRQRAAGVSLRSTHRRLTRHTLLYLRRRARSLNGMPVPDRALPEQHAVSRRRWELATRTTFEIERLEFAVAYRRCPNCAERGPHRQRWCWSCQHEFTGEEDHVADVAVAAARQRLSWLRRQGPDGPVGPPPAAPPFASLGLAESP